MPNDMCSCGKVRYVSKAEATRTKKSKHWHGLTIYECLGFYHLGHPPKRKTRRALAKRGLSR